MERRCQWRSGYGIPNPRSAVFRSSGDAQPICAELHVKGMSAGTAQLDPFFPGVKVHNMDRSAVIETENDSLTVWAEASESAQSISSNQFGMKLAGVAVPDSNR